MQAVSGIVGGIAGLGSAFLGANASKQAANTQANTALLAANMAQGRFDETKNLLMPYITRGYDVGGVLQAMTGTGPGGNPLTAPYTRAFSPTDLEATPGYQFIRDQGLKGVQNSYAARGLGSSGAAMKGAARYVTGLADATYNQQLQNDLTQRIAAFNMLWPQTQQGASSVAALGGLGANYTNTQTGLVTDAGKAQAAGDIGEANAFKSILTPISQYGMLYAMDPTLFRQSVAQSVYGQQPART